MRFLIGSFSHESNSFCAHPTVRQDFEQWELCWGAEVVRAHQGKRTVLGGFVDGLAEAGHQVAGSVSAMAVPSGPVEAVFYRRIRQDLVDSLRAAGPLDGVLLCLHGAMSVEDRAGIEDPEGDLVAAVRQTVGPAVPVVAVFDLHSDTTGLLLDNTDLTLAFNEEPHRDGYERGLEAAEFIQRIRTGEVQPTAVRERVPMLLPAINMATDQGPMAALHQVRAELESLPGVLDLSLHAGFYGADQPEVGFSVVCTTDNDPPLARDLARQMALAAWRRREEFLVELTPIDEAVRRALARPGPTGLIDEADDPAGGGSGDSVAVLRGLLAGGVRSGGISTIKDAHAVRQMVEAGEGAWVQARLGAKTDTFHGDPIQVHGRVLKIYRQPIPVDSWSGTLHDAGPVCLLDVNGILVVVTEHKVITENIDIFDILGFDVTQMQAAGFKGLGLHIRQALAGKIETFVPVDGVGLTHPDVRKLGPYRRIRRPVWPLDDIPEHGYPRTPG